MCGIFGIYNRNGESINVDRLQMATNRLRHRGPNNEGY